MRSIPLCACASRVSMHVQEAETSTRLGEIRSHHARALGRLARSFNDSQQVVGIGISLKRADRPVLPESLRHVARECFEGSICRAKIFLAVASWIKLNLRLVKGVLKLKLERTQHPECVKPSGLGCVASFRGAPRLEPALGLKRFLTGLLDGHKANVPSLGIRSRRWPNQGSRHR